MMTSNITALLAWSDDLVDAVIIAAALELLQLNYPAAAQPTVQHRCEF
jgi:hypothetical protein